MNKNELIYNISNITDADRELLNELQAQLDEELKKPLNQQDLDLVDDVTKAICEIHDETELIEAKTQSGIAYIRSQTKPKNKRSKLRKLIAVCGSCAALVLTVNIASLSVLGMNIFSATYKIFKGGMTIDMNKEEVIELPTTADDPYGMKAKCAEYDMYPLTPSYIPEGFELVNLVAEEFSSFTHTIFYYKKDEIILNFNFSKYNEGEEIPPIGIPTDTYSIVEEEIGGRMMYILKEDNQFTATFQENNIVYLITAIDCSYDECNKVIESLVE